MIQGLNLLCNVGPVELDRSPFLELAFRRRAAVSRAVVTIPDPFGTVRGALAVGQSVRIRFSYRGQPGMQTDWEGTIEAIDQPSATAEDEDAITVKAVGLEKKLTTTPVTESFYNEPAKDVARRLLERTGLPVASVDIPADILPYQIFSGVSVARCLRQIEATLTRHFGRDMTKHAVWLSQDGLHWSPDDEPGDTCTIATAENLLTHTPPVAEGGRGVVTAMLLPGLTHSMKVHIRDSRRGVDATVRAEEVLHTFQARSNSTTVTYGKSEGWL